MTMTQEAIHTAECVELLGDQSPDNVPNLSVPTMYRLTAEQVETVYECPHWAHDIPRQLAHR